VLIKSVKTLLKSEEGAETIEYILITAIIIIVGASAYAIGVGPLLKTAMDALIVAINTALDFG